jgi:hypothetical protein
LVDLIGIEPMTSSMPWKRAPSCATGPHVAGMQLPYCLRWGGIPSNLADGRNCAGKLLKVKNLA